MKYSLRSLVIVVTLIAVMLGVRGEYLRRWAAFHESEAVSIHDRVRRLSIEFDFLIWDGEDSQMYEYHQRLAKEYRAAVCCPWKLVNERAPVGDTELESLAKRLVPTRNSTP